jgi:hypothetical protein
MISSDCPATYASRLRKSLTTLPAAAPAGDATAATTSSAGTVSPDQIKCPLRLTAPQAPADVLRSVGKSGAFLAVFVRVFRPGFERLCDMLEAHRQMELVQHIESWTNARRFSQRPRPLGPIAEDRQLGARRCAKAMQHATQLPSVPIDLGWHTAEDDLLAIIIAGLRNEHLEGPHLIAVRQRSRSASRHPYRRRPARGSFAR